MTRDPQMGLCQVLCWIFQYSWVHLKALRVLYMTAKFQVNNFYSSRAILVPRIAGSRLFKHSFEKIWPVPKKLLQSNILNHKRWESGIWQSIYNSYKLFKTTLMAFLSVKLQDIYPRLCFQAFMLHNTCT